MKYYIDRSMLGYRSGAMPKLKASERWWMYAAFKILDMKDVVGLSRKKLLEAHIAECG